MKKNSLTLLLILAGVPLAFSQNVFGQWKTIDDETGDPKSVVEITERNGRVHGKIIRLFRTPNEDQDPICDECPADDPRHNKKVIGMEIMKDMIADGDEYAGGEILDPKVGKIYRCRIWLEGQNLMVRGYWGPFFRTQTWQRYP